MGRSDRGPREAPARCRQRRAVARGRADLARGAPSGIEGEAAPGPSRRLLGRPRGARSRWAPDGCGPRVRPWRRVEPPQRCRSARRPPHGAHQARGIRRRSDGAKGPRHRRVSPSEPWGGGRDRHSRHPDDDVGADVAGLRGRSVTAGARPLPARGGDPARPRRRRYQPPAQTLPRQTRCWDACLSHRPVQAATGQRGTRDPVRRRSLPRRPAAARVQRTRRASTRSTSCSPRSR